MVTFLPKRALFINFHRISMAVLILALALGLGAAHSVRSGNVSPVDAFGAARVNSVPPGRVTDGVLALYDFSSGSGNTVLDVSGVAPALDLTITDSEQVQWLTGSHGVEFVCTAGGVGNFAPASKIVDNMMAANALTLEAWVIPSSLDQGSSSRRIVSISEDRSTSRLNLQLNQKRDDSKYKLRTDDFNSLVVNNVFSDTSSMKHMVITFDGLTQRMYIDGSEVASDVVAGVVDGPERMFVGGRPTGVPGFTGLMDDMRLSIRARTPTEIAAAASCVP